MIIPEREKGGTTFRVPRLAFRVLVFLAAAFALILGILGYDYTKILHQVYENKHLSTENRQLKEQIQLFQMRINTLNADFQRIHTFEKKLKVITGLDAETSAQTPYLPQGNLPPQASHEATPAPSSDAGQDHTFALLNSPDLLRQDREYLQIKELYENKMAQSFGMETGHRFTREFSDLMKQSFNLAAQFAYFDRQLKLMDKMAQTLEVDIHKLDEHLLNRASFLRSTPTILPTRGWITSFYGRRISPYSGQMKMHEGIDIGAKIGTPVQAPADGVVIFTGRKPGFGILVQIDHGYGIETIFAHANSAAVQKGQLVKRGDLIAHVGNTGMSTGPHLHYEIRVNGTPVDPLYYILN